MKDITGEYKIKIYKEYDYYMADIEIPDGYSGFTQGYNEGEVLEMIADWILIVHDIPNSKWSRFWHKVLRLN